eukprot:GHVU01196367.1.p1 GENE.GHVU01196367.1~~GHVU01196367.1.p1  ORF type:complete len:229 (+),score=13.14 GHVU01196367.1:772-1458(+)
MSATPEATSSGIVEAEGAPSEGPREGAGGGASMRRSSGAGEPLLPPSGAATGPNEQWGEAAGPATGDGKNECGQDDAENDRRGSVATFDGTVDGATRNGCGSRDIDMRTCKAWPENPHERKVCVFALLSLRPYLSVTLSARSCEWPSSQRLCTYASHTHADTGLPMWIVHTYAFIHVCVSMRIRIPVYARATAYFYILCSHVTGWSAAGTSPAARGPVAGCVSNCSLL